MGEVYRAQDAKLGCHVALKVLPQAFATDADRMTQFQREAQVLDRVLYLDDNVPFSPR